MTCASHGYGSCAFHSITENTAPVNTPQYNRIFDHQYPFSKIAAFDHARNDPDHQKKRKRSGRNRNAAGCRKARHKNVSKKHRVHAPFFPRSL